MPQRNFISATVFAGVEEKVDCHAIDPGVADQILVDLGAAAEFPLDPGAVKLKTRAETNSGTRCG